MQKAHNNVAEPVSVWDPLSDWVMHKRPGFTHSSWISHEKYLNPVAFHHGFQLLSLFADGSLLSYFLVWPAGPCRWGALVSFLHLHLTTTELSAPWAWVHDQQQKQSWLLGRRTEAHGELCPCGATTAERMLWEPQWCKNTWLWQPRCHAQSSWCIGVVRAPVVVHSNLVILSSRVTLPHPGPGQTVKGACLICVFSRGRSCCSDAGLRAERHMLVGNILTLVASTLLQVKLLCSDHCCKLNLQVYKL